MPDAGRRRAGGRIATFVQAQGLLQFSRTPETFGQRYRRAGGLSCTRVGVSSAAMGKRPGSLQHRPVELWIEGFFEKKVRLVKQEVGSSRRVRKIALPVQASSPFQVVAGRPDSLVCADVRLRHS